MRDPVVLSSGHTYDRIAVNDYFVKFGHRDPQTNNEVNPNCVIDNINLKKQIEVFIAENPGFLLENKGQGELEKK